MAGIDKIYLRDFKEYQYFEDFCARHNQEFLKKHNYYLSCRLYDGVTEETFKDGSERPVSNFSTEADVFIIKHMTDKDVEYMPNVVSRLKEQYPMDYDLIREGKSKFDLYYINYSRPKLRLIESSNHKTLRHIKREKWEYVDVVLLPVEQDWGKSFNNILRVIYDRLYGCKYYKSNEDEVYGYEDLFNISVGKVYQYITRTMLHKGTQIRLRCFDLNKDHRIAKESVYLFEVI